MRRSRAIEVLGREHGLIAALAECLETLVADSRASGQLAPEAGELLGLYESFADGRHQEKEEAVLFLELLSVADEVERAALGRLLDDHRGERAHMASMRLHLMGALSDEPGCVRAFARAAGEYMDLHRQHMQRENEGLFPMAARLLSAEADARVVAGFEAMEGGADDPHALVEQVASLRARVGLPVPPAA